MRNILFNRKTVLNVSSTVVIWILMGMVLTGCVESYDKVRIEMNVSPVSLGDFPSGGGEKTLTITSNTKWTVSSDANWITFSPSNGAGQEDGTVTIRAAENKGFAQLTATITIKGTGFSDQTHTVRIAATTPNLTVTPVELSMVSAGETKDLTIESNVSWEIIRSADWVSVTPSEGKGDQIVRVAATANQTSVERNAIITVRSTDTQEERTIQIKQEAATFFIEVSPSSLEFEAAGGSKPMQISSNTSWILGNSSDPCTGTAPCLTISPDQGENSREVMVNVTQNQSVEPRIFEFCFWHVGYDIDMPPHVIFTSNYITVIQQGAAPILNVPAVQMDFPSSGGTQTFDILSNTNWSVTSNVAWLTLLSNWSLTTEYSSTVEGFTGGVITVKADPNLDTNERSATITVDLTGPISTPGQPLTRTIQVTQAGVTVIEEPEPEMVQVKGGFFTMGCTIEQGLDCDVDERPSKDVTVSDFYIGKYEVTQALWTMVMGGNPSSNKGDNLPVEYVSWNDIQEFITELNRMTGKQYRLPTEAEWEYAARGGNNSQGYKYSGSNTAGDVAWYSENSGGATHAAGTKAPNELGIYDMSGNVYEWCSDWYGNYSGNPQTNPKGPDNGAYRVVHGGSYYNLAWYSRVSKRSYYVPSYRSPNIGFRLAHDSN